MAHNSDYSLIYVDPSSSGLSVAEIARAVVRTTQDVGQLCSDKNANGVDQNKINGNSVIKPFRSSIINPSMADRAAANFGWSILKKAAGTAVTTFMAAIAALGEDGLFWQHLKPRGMNGGGTGVHEWFRVLDFNGYRRLELPYRHPITFNRIAATEISGLSGTYVDYTATKHSTTQFFHTSNNFSLTEAFDVTVLMELISPVGNSSEYYDLDGSFDITLYDSRGYVVAHDYETLGVTQTGGTVQAISLHFEGFLPEDAYVGPFYIQYRVLMDNQTNHVETTSPVYDDVVFRITTSYAATLRKNRLGQQGIYIKLSGESEAWRSDSYLPRTTIFGSNGHWPIAIITVNNGSTSQTKMASVPFTGFIPFKRIGITIEPRQQDSLDDIIVYLVYGNRSQIFPNYQQQVDYGDVSLANSKALVAAPQAYKRLGIIAAPPAGMAVYSDDCQGITIWFAAGHIVSGATPGPNGITNYSAEDTDKMRMTWDMIVENCPVAATAEVHLAAYDGTADDDLYDESVENYSLSADSSQTISISIDVNLPPNDASDVLIKFWVVIFGTPYYFWMYPQSLSTNNPGKYNIGSGQLTPEIQNE